MKRATVRAQSREAGILSAQLKEHGGVPVNPFKAIRESSGLTLVEFADNCGISKQSLIRLEQGMFVSPLESVMDYVVNELGHNWLALTDGYEQYQDDCRERAYRMFGDMPNVDEFASFIMVHPFRVMRSYHTSRPLNLTFVAKQLCLSQASLEHFERRIKHQQSVPVALQEVLLRIGYTKTEVAIFKEAFQYHRAYALGHAVDRGIMAPAQRTAGSILRAL